MFFKLSRLNLLLPIAMLLAVALMGCSPIRSPSSGWSGAAVDSGILYVGTREGEVLALDASTGEEHWRFPQEGKDGLGGVYGTPAVKEGKVYVGGYDGKVYALEATTGRKVWEFATNGPIVGGCSIAGNLLLVGSDDGSLYALSLEGSNTGKPIWRFPSEGKVGRVWSTPVVNEETVYFGSLDHSLYALRLRDGSMLWEFKAEGAIASTPTVSQGRVYVGSFDRKFYAIDAQTGRNVFWSYTAGNWYWSRAVLDQTTIYIPSLDGNLYALDAYTGALRWSFDTAGPILSSPVVVSGRAVVASDSGKISVLSAQGTEEWSYDTGAPIRAPLAHDGTVVYLIDMDRTIRALDVIRGRQLWETNTKK